VELEYVLSSGNLKLLHCNENPIYLFPEKELRGLSPSFHIQVSARDLYISRISPHIVLQQNMHPDPVNM
jgi:hypothetical protein